MNIVAIESSGLVASVAILADDRLVAEYTMNNKQTHSQTLLPMIDEIVRASGMTMEEMDAVAISRGPGSFTGLRIGSATAKGLGLALGKPLIEVPTLEAMAYNLFGTKDTVICPIMDARRGEVYTAAYESLPDYHIIIEETAIPLVEMIDRLNDIGRPVIFLGDAVPVYPEVIEQSIKVPYSLAPAHLSRQRAASVAIVAAKYYEEGKVVNAGEHAPTYLRVSQAEREKAEQVKEK